LQLLEGEGKPTKNLRSAKARLYLCAIDVELRSLMEKRRSPRWRALKGGSIMFGVAAASRYGCALPVEFFARPCDVIEGNGGTPAWGDLNRAGVGGPGCK
jgi:hypothetical protein